MTRRYWPWAWAYSPIVYFHFGWRPCSRRRPTVPKLLSIIIITKHGIIIHASDCFSIINRLFFNYCRLNFVKKYYCVLAYSFFVVDGRMIIGISGKRAWHSLSSSVISQFLGFKTEFLLYFYFIYFFARNCTEQGCGVKVWVFFELQESDPESVSVYIGRPCSICSLSNILYFSALFAAPYSQLKTWR